MNKRAVLFVNGELPDSEAVNRILQTGDLVIAVDGGFSHLQAVHRNPDLLVGDLDSIEPQAVAQLEAQGVEICRFPVKKDETDLELALRIALKRGAVSIRIVGALGGRLDQTLGNIFLLMLPELGEVDVRLDDGFEEVFLIRSSCVISGSAGDGISLLPLQGAVQGVTTRGLEYPLSGETLLPERTRGISNVMQADTAEVSIQNGFLLCVHTRRRMLEIRQGPYL